LFNTDINFVGATVFVSYEQGGQIVGEKSGTDGQVEVPLAQEETPAFSEDRRVRMQIRYIPPDGKAGSSNIMTALVTELLKEGE